jgi:hypothetical protein
MGIKGIIVSTLLIFLHGFSDITYPDFMVSMSRKGADFHKFEEFFINNQNDCSRIQNLELFRTCYTRNVLLSQGLKNSYRIPKMIHQIWLGSPVPVKYTAWMKSWAELLDWEYRLWTDDDVNDILLYNQDLYDQASNYGEKSDILRLELLLHYGGIYVDIDFECINGNVFDELNRSFDFFVGFEPIEHGVINGTYKICNAIIAACPYHPIIKNLMINMRSNWEQFMNESAVQKSGPDYFSRMILSYEKGNLLSPEVKNNNSKYRNMYLPCTFLYPFSEPNIKYAKTRQELIDQISPETAAIHYWSGSWLPIGARPQ